MMISVEGGLPRRWIHGSEDVGDELVDLLGSLPQETVIVVSLGPNGRVLGLDAVSLGSRWQAAIEVQLFSGVLKRGGTAVIVAHNHTSGLTNPSAADIDFTVALLETGRLLRIDVVDHLIVTKDSWRSLKESPHPWVQGGRWSDGSNSRGDELL